MISHIEGILDEMSSAIVAVSLAARKLRGRAVSAGAHESIREMYDKLDDLEELMMECEAYEAALTEEMGGV